MQETREMWVWSLGQEDPLEKGNGNPLQYSCLENPMDRGAWRATVHGVAKSQTWLSTHTHTHAAWIPRDPIYLEWLQPGSPDFYKRHCCGDFERCGSPARGWGRGLPWAQARAGESQALPAPRLLTCPVSAVTTSTPQRGLPGPSARCTFTASPARCLLHVRALPYRPHMPPPGPYAHTQSGHLVTSELKGCQETSICCCLGVLAAAGAGRWQAMIPEHPYKAGRTLRKHCSWPQSGLARSHGWARRWVSQPQYQDHTIQPWLCCQVQAHSACLMHSEAKQYWNTRVWDRGLLHVHGRRTGDLCTKNSELPDDFSKAFLKKKVGHRVCDQLLHSSLTGWRWCNRVVKVTSP